MPTTILLIENDAGFAREITEALEGAGYQVRATGDGKEGLDLAREVSPAAIVLCVELPKMSGYSICQKLKKDDALKGIPLILTSAEATAETFEQHKKLKARAEDYLLKPYAPADLLALLAPLAGQPEAPAGEEEVVSLEEELGLEMLAGEAEGELPALDLASLPDEPAPGAGGAPLAAGGEDEDLRLLDDAFAGLSGPPATTPAPVPAPRPAEEAPPARDAGADLDLALEGDRPVGADEVEAAAATMPPEETFDDRVAFDAASDEADLALGVLGGEESPAAALDALDALDGPSEAALQDEPAAAAQADDFAPELAAALDLAPDAPAAQVRGASADALRAAGIALLDDGPPAPPPALKVVPPLPEPEPVHPRAGLAGVASGAELGRLEAELADRRAALAARDAELRDLQDRLDALTHRAVDAESALSEKEAEAAAARARAEALTAQVKRGEADLKAGREEARKAADQVRAAEDRARAADGQASAAAEKARAAEERARAAEGQAAAATEKARAAEERAAAAAEKARVAEERAAAATAEAARHRASAAEAARGLESKLTELAVATAAVARLEGVEREVEELKTELIVARGEVEGARSEVENRGAELKKRISELEAANSKNEERVVKAYLKIKGDEKVRDKARKALAIALQLLEEGLPAEQPGAARPPASGGGAAKLD